MDPFVASTVAKWLKVSEKQYDELYMGAKLSGLCLEPKCNFIRDNHQDMLCPLHRIEYNEWTKQFFLKNNPVEEQKTK
jgi:hypothetical protein